MAAVHALEVLPPAWQSNAVHGDPGILALNGHDLGTMDQHAESVSPALDMQYKAIAARQSAEPPARVPMHADARQGDGGELPAPREWSKGHEVGCNFQHPASREDRLVFLVQYAKTTARQAGLARAPGPHSGCVHGDPGLLKKKGHCCPRESSLLFGPVGFTTPWTTTEVFAWTFISKPALALPVFATISKPVWGFEILPTVRVV